MKDSALASRRTRRGVPNKITQDLRNVIEQAFHKAGGRDYLVKVAHRRPDVFLALVGKIIPSETRLSVLASYQALPVPVEQRDTSPLLAADVSPETLTAVYDVIPDLVPAADTDDWLS